jgi:single-strand DNA-binding protein
MAARCLNKVTLIGNLGANPEVRYTQNGHAIANVSLATTAARRDKESGDFQERTEWHRVVFFNRLAEIVGEFLKKGSKLRLLQPLQGCFSVLIWVLLQVPSHLLKKLSISLRWAA